MSAETHTVAVLLKSNRDRATAGVADHPPAERAPGIRATVADSIGLLADPSTAAGSTQKDAAAATTATDNQSINVAERATNKDIGHSSTSMATSIGVVDMFYQLIAKLFHLVDKTSSKVEIYSTLAAVLGIPKETCITTYISTQQEHPKS